MLVEFSPDRVLIYLCKCNLIGISVVERDRLPGIHVHMHKQLPGTTGTSTLVCNTMLATIPGTSSLSFTRYQQVAEIVLKQKLRLSLSDVKLSYSDDEPFLPSIKTSLRKTTTVLQR